MCRVHVCYTLVCVCVCVPIKNVRWKPVNCRRIVLCIRWCSFVILPLRLSFTRWQIWCGGGNGEKGGKKGQKIAIGFETRRNKTTVVFSWKKKMAVLTKRALSQMYILYSPRCGDFSTSKWGWRCEPKLKRFFFFCLFSFSIALTLYCYNCTILIITIIILIIRGITIERELKSWTSDVVSKVTNKR